MDRVKRLHALVPRGAAVCARCGEPRSGVLHRARSTLAGQSSERHRIRQLADGRFVCSGGVKQNVVGANCPFSSTSLADARAHGLVRACVHTVPECEACKRGRLADAQGYPVIYQ